MRNKNFLSSKCIIVNGVMFPPPNAGFSVSSTQGVDGANNSVNEFVGQKVGRRKWKLDGLEWDNLPVETWRKMMAALADFVVPVTFTDDRNIRRTISMYPGDTTATPASFDEETLQYTEYTNCKVNLVDCGIISEGEGDE